MSKPLITLISKLMPPFLSEAGSERWPKDADGGNDRSFGGGRTEVPVSAGLAPGLALALALAIASPAWSLAKNSVSGSKSVRPILQKVQQRAGGLSLDGAGSESSGKSADLGGITTDQLLEAIKSSGAVPPQGVQLSQGQGYRLDLVAGASRSQFHSYIDGYKVCGASVKAVPLGADIFLVGNIPSLEPRASYDHDDFSPAATLADRFADRWYGQKITMDASAPCLYPDQSRGYLPAHEVWFAVGDRQFYRGYHDGDEFLELHPIGFDVDGSSRIYESNPKDGTIRTFDLLGLTETGRLTNRYFVTQMDAQQSGNSRVFVSSNQFYFEDRPTSDAFAETSVFTNANRILGFFSSLDYSAASFGSRAITLNLAPGFAGNAQYIPSNTSNPIISIGDDEPGRLENLRLDMDVVNHEFGHHVVFGSLRDTGKVIDGTRQVLVMHEALADYFTFAFSGDGCLGESLCPSGSALCSVQGQCLRSAETAMTMTSNPDIGLNKEHLRGQFMSAFLWDIRKEAAVDATTFDKMVLKAVNLLSSDSGYQDFVLNLYLTDRNTNSSSYCSIIQTHAATRGLNAYLSYNCASGEYQKLDIGGGGDTTSTTRSSSTKSSSGFFSFCGTIKGHPQLGETISFWYVLAGLIPLLGLLRRRNQEDELSDG